MSLFGLKTKYVISNKILELEFGLWPDFWLKIALFETFLFIKKSKGKTKKYSYRILTNNV